MQIIDNINYTATRWLLHPVITPSRLRVIIIPREGADSKADHRAGKYDTAKEAIEMNAELKRLRRERQRL